MTTIKRLDDSLAIPALTGAGTATGDLFLVWDVSAGAYKSITRAELILALGGGASLALDTRAALRASTTTADYVLVKGNAAAFDGWGGVFAYDAADTTTVDDGALTIVTAGNARYKRVFDGPLRVEWYGIVGNGTTDDTAAWQALFDGVPNGTVVLAKNPDFIMKLTSTITLTAKRGVTIRTGIDARNNGYGAQFKWFGANHGRMMHLDACQQCLVEGFTWTTNGNTVDKAIDIDGDTPIISTQNAVRYNSFGIGQSNASAKIVSISDTVTTNNENMEVSYNDFTVSSGSRGTAAGVGIYVGASPNAKHQYFPHNNISQAAVAIKMDGGSCTIEDLGGGANGLDIRLRSTTETVSIINLKTEHSLQQLDALNANVRCTGARISNTDQTDAGGTIKINGGAASFANTKFDSGPPVGGTLWEFDGSPHVTVHDTTFADGTLWTETGLDTYFTGVNGLATLTMWNFVGLNNAPGRFMHLGKVANGASNIVGLYTTTPIGVAESVFADISAAVALNGLHVITDSHTRTPGEAITGGGSYSVLGYNSSDGWIVAAAAGAAAASEPVEFDFSKPALPEGVTVAGGLNGTVFDAWGRNVRVPADTPAFTYYWDNGSSAWLYQGLQNEAASTNFALQSEDLSNWNTAGASAASPAAVEPDRTVALQLTTEDNANSAHDIYKNPTSLAAGADMVASAFAQAGTQAYTYVNIQGGGYFDGVFTLAAATVGETKQAGSGVFISSAIRRWGADLRRVEVAGNPGGNNPYQVFGLCGAASGNTFDGGGEITYLGTGKTIYLRGFQVEAGLVASSYIPTRLISVTRSAVVITIPQSEIPDGVYDIVITRNNFGSDDVTTISGHTVTNGYVVPNHRYPLKSISFTPV